MKSHPFDAFAMLLARGLSRRDLLRLLGSVAAAAAARPMLPGLRLAAAGGGAQQAPDEPQPPPFWPPDFPLDPPGKAIDDYVDCIAAGNDPADCDKGVPWCEIREYLWSHAFPNLTGIIETAGPFGEDCGTTDCLQCCYVPANNGCHSSYIGEDVINCTPRIYGEGTRGVGLTLLLDEPPPDGTCLFTPQVCTHVGICMQGAEGVGAAHALAGPQSYLADPRALKQRARVFAMYALAQARHYLDEYATDTPDGSPLQELHDAVFGRGWATWREDMAGLSFDLNDPLFRVVDGADALVESAARANVLRTFALLRLLSGLPNLAARLAHVESRVWGAADRDVYLVATPDPDAALAETLGPHMVAILSRVPSLQDYRLLAVPLPGEAGAGGTYGGMPLGRPPTLRLEATAAGLAVALTATLEDPTGGAGPARPVAVDWGDGRVSHGELPAGQASLTFAHEYAAGGRYAIYVVAANTSGLRGAACAVVEVAAPAGAALARPAQAAPPVCVRAGLTGISVSNLPFTKVARLSLSFTDAAGNSFLAGRSRVAEGPTNITVPVELGAAYAHNPSRVEVTTLTVEPRHSLTAPSGGRVPSFTLATLLLGVFSTAQMRPVEVEVPLRPDLLALYTAGAVAPLPVSAVTVSGDGTLTLPLLYRAATGAPWERVERVEIALAAELFAGLALDAAPTSLPVGTRATWVERRPGTFERVADPGPPDGEGPPPEGPASHRVYAPLVVR
ncbi:MAG TPA: hypothetical protein PKD53_24570 [Chloroflexaceae bacterium]|nr:hypothetical protein [Chloroflexaceae bacterium]